MQENALERIGAGTGILFVILLAAGFQMDAAAPDFETALAAEVRSFHEATSSVLFWSENLRMIGWVAFLWFLGTLREVLLRANANRSLVSAGSWAGILCAGSFLLFHALRLEFSGSDLSELDDAAVLSRWLILDASFAFFGGTTFLRVALLTAMSAAIIKYRALPPWLGWAGVAVAALNLLDGFDLLAAIGVALLDFILFLAWVLATSVVLLKRLPDPAFDKRPFGT